MGLDKNKQGTVDTQKTTLTISVTYDTEKLNRIIKIFEKENQDYIYELKKLIPGILDRFIELEEHELYGNENQIDI